MGTIQCVSLFLRVVV